MASLKLLFIVLMTTCLPLAQCVVPPYLPSTDYPPNLRLELIQVYFNAGFKYIEIVLLLISRHGISISLRHLKRLLKQNNLSRRNVAYSPQVLITELIRNESRESGQCIGYRSMWRRLVRDHGVKVKRNDVMKIMRDLDPEATEMRKAHKLKRRLYTLKGPNYVWHIDGYDKIKPFGFCIHGCIDGYSRRIMWLEVSASNNNPRLIARYYLDCLKEMKCAPRILRADHGTENSSVSFLQPMFRFNAADSMSGLGSYMEGKSTSNQRIESFWGILRRSGLHWWINLFKDMKDVRIFNPEDHIHRECLKYCFMDVIQAELDSIAQHWNMHEIRSQKRYPELPHGKPDVLYFVPELFDGRDFGTPVDPEDVQACIEMYSVQKTTCSTEFEELARLLKPDIQMPIDATEAAELYVELIEQYERNV